jgi:tRNA(His) guanylyltransferase
MTKVSESGAKFKSYEREVESHLPENILGVIRLDGKAFHTFTKNFERPYDKGFAETMNRVAEHLCDTVNGALFAYTQSDEISVVFSDLPKKDVEIDLEDGSKHVITGSSKNPQLWLGGRVEKFVSIAAANATAKYMTVSPTKLFPIFDARLHPFKESDEVLEYVEWRRADAQKNAITMAASVLYSHKELMSISTAKRRELLVGTKFEVLPPEFLHGRITRRQYSMETVEFVDKRDNTVRKIVAPRSRWVTSAATDENVSKLIADVIS